MGAPGIFVLAPDDELVTWLEDELALMAIEVCRAPSLPELSRLFVDDAIVLVDADRIDPAEVRRHLQDRSLRALIAIGDQTVSRQFADAVLPRNFTNRALVAALRVK